MRYMVVRTENLTKYYGRTRGIDALTMEVEPGEVYGLLGPAGAGKSTLMRLLLDFVRPTSGLAYVLFMDTRQHSMDIRRQVGYLPANLALDARLTAGEMLTYLANLRGKVEPARIGELAERFNLNLAGRIAALSEGERQKIGLVQAFMHEPQLYILDDPARGLDAAARAAFYNLVAEERAAGRSVFFSTTQLSEAERVCDRVGVMNAGSMVAVERGVQLRARALRKVEMRFGCPVPRDAFSRLPNVRDVHLEDNFLHCTVQGDPDALIKAASQYRITDFISQQPSLEETFRAYYGVNGDVAT